MRGSIHMEQANNIEKYFKILEKYKSESETYYRGQLEKYTTMPHLFQEIKDI